VTALRPRESARLVWWLVLVLIAVVILVVVLFQLRERGEPTRAAERGAHDLVPSKSDTGGFPPPFPDARPDLSKRADYVEVCGVGRIPSEPEDKFWPEYEESGRRLLEKTAPTLAASRNDLDRALALYVTAMLVASRDPPKESGEPQRVSDEAFQPLARLAVATRDPEAYALAFHRCRPFGACAQLSSAHWAQLEPDNAVPWLHEADLAQLRNDPAGVDAALQRASKARKLEPYMGTPLRPMDTAAVRSAPPLEANAALGFLAGLAAATPFPNLQLVTQYCAQAAKGAAQRKQVCSDLAEVFAERSTVLLGITIGAKLGEQAGWPSERIAPVSARMKALQQVQAPDQTNPYSCAALERQRRYFADFARLGEVAAAERAAIAGQQPK